MNAAETACLRESRELRPRRDSLDVWVGTQIDDAQPTCDWIHQHIKLPAAWSRIQRCDEYISWAADETNAQNQIRSSTHLRTDADGVWLRLSVRELVPFEVICEVIWQLQRLHAQFPHCPANAWCCWPVQFRSGVFIIDLPDDMNTNWWPWLNANRVQQKPPTDELCCHAIRKRAVVDDGDIAAQRFPEHRCYTLTAEEARIHTRDDPVWACVNHNVPWNKEGLWRWIFRQTKFPAYVRIGDSDVVEALVAGRLTHPHLPWLFVTFPPCTVIYDVY